jgi:polyhydroxyalkanoate synthesis regulator phasin
MSLIFWPFTLLFGTKVQSSTGEVDALRKRLDDLSSLVHQGGHQIADALVEQTALNKEHQHKVDRDLERIREIVNRNAVDTRDTSHMAQHMVDGMNAQNIVLNKLMCLIPADERPTPLPPLPIVASTLARNAPPIKPATTDRSQADIAPEERLPRPPNMPRFGGPPGGKRQQ